jgi:hypothetical protein
MRGRLPDIPSDHPTCADALTSLPDPPPLHEAPHEAPHDTLEEDNTIREHIRDIDNDICLCLSVPADTIDPYTVTQREHFALLGIARLVQHDMHLLQSGLCTHSSSFNAPDMLTVNLTDQAFFCTGRYSMRWSPSRSARWELHPSSRLE